MRLYLFFIDTFVTKLFNHTPMSNTTVDPTTPPQVSKLAANIITRAVGVARDLRVDTVSGDAKPRDQFLLATDGVTRLLSDAELATELSTNPPAIAARKLIETVLARGAPDNASLIIIKIL